MNRLPASTKVWLFLLLITLVILVIGYKLGDRLGLFLGFLSAVGFHTLVYFYGDSQLLKFFKARHIRGNDAWGIQDILRKYALLLQIPKPALYVIESNDAIAFSLGHNWQRGAICVSTGLLKRLNEKEVESVLAHQICHIHRLDTFGFGVAHVVAFAIVGLGKILDYFWILKLLKPIKRLRLARPFSNLFSPLAWFILKLAVTDKVYFQNDDMAAALLHDRKVLAEALWKLEGFNQAHPLTIPPCSNHFFIVNPTGLTEKNWFLLAHPKIDTRIRRLIGYFPI